MSGGRYDRRISRASASTLRSIQSRTTNASVVHATASSQRLRDVSLLSERHRSVAFLGRSVPGGLVRVPDLPPKSAPDRRSRASPGLAPALHFPDRLPDVEARGSGAVRRGRMEGITHTGEG